MTSVYDEQRFQFATLKHRTLPKEHCRFLYHWRTFDGFQKLGYEIICDAGVVRHSEQEEHQSLYLCVTYHPYCLGACQETNDLGCSKADYHICGKHKDLLEFPQKPVRILSDERVWFSCSTQKCRSLAGALRLSNSNTRSLPLYQLLTKSAQLLRRCIGDAYRTLLYGFLSWTYFIFCIRSKLQIKLDRTQDFAVQRTVIVVCAFVYCLMKMFLFVRNTNSNFYHATIITAFGRLVKPQLLRTNAY